MVLNPLGDLGQGVQGLLSAFGDQLLGQLLVGNGAGALASVAADQRRQISGGCLAVQNCSQGGIQVILRDLGLVGQGG